MVSVNRSMQAGYLTRDPELTKVVTRDGEEVAKCEFTLAINHYKDEGVDYIPVVVWRKMAEDLVEYKRKGEPVYVEGSLRYSRWEKEGSPRSRVVLVAELIQYLPSRRYYEEQQASASAAA